MTLHCVCVCVTLHCVCVCVTLHCVCVCVCVCVCECVCASSRLGGGIYPAGWGPWGQPMASWRQPDKKA